MRLVRETRVGERARAGPDQIGSDQMMRGRQNLNAIERWECCNGRSVMISRTHKLVCAAGRQSFPGLVLQWGGLDSLTPVTCISSKRDMDIGLIELGGRERA